MTGIDWGIILLAIGLGAWGYRHGLIVALATVAGFSGGAILGARVGPALLQGGSSSPYAPMTALVGGLVIGGLAAFSLEGVARQVRLRLINPGPRAVADGAGGAVVLVALSLGMAWVLGAVALNAPNSRDLRRAVQQSAILGALNDRLPPSGFILNALNRIDPVPRISGPDPGVAGPESQIVGDPEVRAAARSVVRILGTACGLGVSGSGWVAAPGLVVTNAHVVAGQDDTTVSRAGSEQRLDATVVLFDPRNDLAMLRVGGLAVPALSLAGDPQRGTLGAVLGYPENGPFRSEPARLGTTGTVVTQDAYGHGRINRELTGFRGVVRSGNSGGPVVDAEGRVLTTVFASTISQPAGGYGVPNDITAAELPGVSSAAVSAGPCVR